MRWTTRGPVSGSIADESAAARLFQRRTMSGMHGDRRDLRNNNTACVPARHAACFESCNWQSQPKDQAVNYDPFPLYAPPPKYPK